MKRESAASLQAVPASVAGSFVLLRADKLRLLLPQQDVGAAEYIEHAPRATATAGLFEYGTGQGLRYIVALSEQLQYLPVFPGGRFVLTRLMAGDAQVCFAWNEVRVLIAPELAPRPLPAAMRAKGAPIDDYVEHEGEVLLCSTADRVVRYLADDRI